MRSRTPTLLTAAIALALACATVPTAPTRAAAAEATFTVKGGGWGHGIGMSQWGAYGYAKKGWDYKRILAHYYQDTKIRTLPTEKVRVNLDSGAHARSQWRIQSGTSSRLTIADASTPESRIVLSATATYWITTSGGNTRVQPDYAYKVVNDGETVTMHKPYPGKVLKTFTGESYAFSGGIVKMLSSSGPYERRSVKWRGTIHFKPKTASTAKAVNYVDLESYLYGVVPCEIGATWPAESVKAQSVAARSYAYQSAKEDRTIYCTTMSQVYGGYSVEHSASNAAVNATKGQLVWYGTESRPVQTFFFSSSGGHTANIEDVWTAATPKPYFTGVTDADEASPHYTWTRGPYSATQLTSMVRGHDGGGGDSLDYSAPAPHKIVSVTAERADSGYAHHVNLKWSNGATYRIKGDTFRSALELRSTKFGITSSTPVTVRSYEQSRSELAWYGKWATEKIDAASGDSLKGSSTVGSKSSIEFKGTSVAWYGSRGPGHGRARVYLDGTYLTTVDLYASSTSHNQRLFSRSGIASGSHRFTVKIDTGRNAKSTGHRVTVDRFAVGGTIAEAHDTNTKYEQTSSRVAWLGPWRTSTTSGASGGSEIVASSTSAEVRMRFYGTGVTWVGSRGPAYGKARVTLDGTSTDVTLTASETKRQQTLFSVRGLDQSKTHTLVIRSLGAGSGGTAGRCSIDRLGVSAGWATTPLLPTVKAEETARSISYSSGWKRATNPKHSGGAHKFTRTTGATATLRFEGSSVRWIATKANMYGKAAVYLDGTRVATVDQYAATRAYQRTIFAKTGLPCRPHTLVIKALGTRRAAATDDYVSVDAFVVTGRAQK